MKMDKVIVREARVPSSPPKEQERKGQFSITEGGYLLKNHGERFSTEVGLWRHIDILKIPETSFDKVSESGWDFCASVGEEPPNKAPEPTAFAVTPRASSRLLA